MERSVPPPQLSGQPLGESASRLAVPSLTVTIDDVSRYDVTLRLGPIWNARHGVVGSYIIEPQIVVSDGFDFASASLCDVSPRIALEVAKHTISFAKSILRDNAQPSRPFGLHIPISIEAVTPSLQRQDLVRALKGIDTVYRNRLIIEIADISPGAPQSRVSDLLAALRPYGRGVLARMTQFAPPAQCWRRIGLSGVAFLMNSGPHLSDYHLGGMPSVTRGQGDFPVVACHGIASQQAAQAAWQAGFTHFSGPFISSDPA